MAIVRLLWPILHDKMQINFVQFGSTRARAFSLSLTTKLFSVHFFTPTNKKMTLTIKLLRSDLRFSEEDFFLIFPKIKFNVFRYINRLLHFNEFAQFRTESGMRNAQYPNCTI